MPSRLDDPVGPGCGWAFTGQVGPPYDATAEAVAAQGRVAQAQLDLSVAQQAWQANVVQYWSQVADYTTQADAYSAYAAAVRKVAVAWDRITAERTAYAAAVDTYNAAAAAREQFLLDQAAAQTDYDTAVALCGGVSPSTTPSPSALALVDRPVGRSARRRCRRSSARSRRPCRRCPRPRPTPARPADPRRATGAAQIRETVGVPDRDRSSDLGFSAALNTRSRGIDTFGMVVRISLATTVSYLLAHAVSGSALPVFAPITTLFVVQSSPFSTLGMTAQRVLGTGLGVLVATVYVSWVPITWWSVFLALVTSLLIARMLPTGLVGQLQIPVATVFVLALGPGDLAVDLWRVADVVLGGLVGVAAVFVFPPRPRLTQAQAALTAYAGELTAFLREMATEPGTHASPLPKDTRHAFIGTSRHLRTTAGTTRDAVAHALESALFNVRARGVSDDLDLLERELHWLTRIAIQSRALSGAIDRLYDRAGVAPALPVHLMRGLMAALADLVDAVARDGVDEDAHAISDAMADDVRLAVEITAGSVDVVEALGSLSLLGRIEQLRDIAVTGPIPLDEVESAPDDDLRRPGDRRRPTATRAADGRPPRPSTQRRRLDAPDRRRPQPPPPDGS